MTVALVAAGGLDVGRAIPIIMGANIGTSVTNTLVSVGHISRPAEFKRAFAAATIHDFFNLISVVVIFPLQLGFNVLGRSATFLTDLFGASAGLKLANPLKAAVKPAVKLISHGTGDSGWLTLIISIILLFIALRYIVVILKQLVIGRVEAFFSAKLFKNAGRAMLLGLVLTVAVQSSSITTSLAVPLAGAGILTLIQILPFTLGANVGTTVTAMLASLVTGDPSAVTVAFAHLLFNIFGIILVWPFRRLPLFLARQLARWSLRSKLIPLVYVTVMFFIVPIILIYLVG
jgi:sodium-dependent phosphate cotransporter